MPLTLRTAQQDLTVWDECAIDGDVVGPRAAHAEDPPGVEHGDALGLERQREMQHRRAGLRIVPHRAGDEHVADRDTAGEDLPRGNVPATLNALGLTRSCNPVRAPAADKHEILSG